MIELASNIGFILLLFIIIIVAALVITMVINTMYYWKDWSERGRADAEVNLNWRPKLNFLTIPHAVPYLIARRRAERKQ